MPLKGTKEIEVEIGTIVVSVECDPDTGFDGKLSDLEESVTQLVLEDIEELQSEGNGWMTTSVSVKMMP